MRSKAGRHDRRRGTDEGAERRKPEGAGLEDLTRENDPLSAAFDVEAFHILRRTPTDLALGGLVGSQSRLRRAVSAVATRSHPEACEANFCAWMDGASSSDEDGTETAPGASAWVQARPVGEKKVRESKRESRRQR